MKKQVQFSPEQIQAMLDFLNANRQDSSKYEKLKFLYNANTPKDIYAKYVSYELMDDNGIASNLQVVCVHPDGSTSDCYAQFDNLRQQMAFNEDFVEIDLDNKGRMVLA
jgi:hypothetical protein